MRVSSTFIAWSNENKSCMRVDKREFTWGFHQLSLLDQTRTRVAWELTSESSHESFINFHCVIKREQELHESWQARVYMRVSSTFIAWSNENKSCMRVEKLEFIHESFINFHCLIKRKQKLHESCKREFTWKLHQLSLLDQRRTRFACDLTRESLHESFINCHCLIKQEQDLHESWQARVYMRVLFNFHCLIKREQVLHESLMDFVS